MRCSGNEWAVGCGQWAVNVSGQSLTYAVEIFMRLDIRVPIGLLFIVLGIILVVFGVLSQFGLLFDKEIYNRSLDINVNLWWGLAMLIFGGLMFFAGQRGTSSVRTTEESLEGKRLEETERRREGH